MKKMEFQLPYYKVDVALLQVEGKEDENDVAILESYIRSGEWSESHIDRALGIVDELVNKCKSPKDRVQPKQEWSEEDALRLEEVMCMIEANGRWVRSDDAVKLNLDWLKSLEQRIGG